MPEQTTGQEPTPAGQVPPDLNTAAADTKGEPKVFDEAYVKTLRAENAQWRKQAQEAAAKVTTFEQERMSEAEKLQAQTKAAQEAAAAASQRLQQALADAAISRAAAKEGVDPELLGKLVTVEFDADGAPVGLEANVAAVLNKYPQLKPAAPVPGATNPGRGPRKLTLEDIKKMSPEEINSRWTEVQATLAGG